MYHFEKYLYLHIKFQGQFCKDMLVKGKLNINMTNNYMKIHISKSLSSMINDILIK